MTPAQARALEKQKQTMDERGEKIVSVRLSERARVRLAWLRKSYGSRQKVIEALLSGD